MSGWKDLFREHILARGEMYYYDGAVQDLEKTEHGYHARGGGHGRTTKWTSKWKTGQICEMYCTCPYAADGNNCKHMAAVLYEIAEQEGSEGSLAEGSSGVGAGGR